MLYNIIVWYVAVGCSVSIRIVMSVHDMYTRRRRAQYAEGSLLAHLMKEDTVQYSIV